MEWGIRVSALPEKAGGSAGNGQQQKVTEGSHQKLSTLGKTYVALQETASPFKSNVGEVQHLLTSEQNYPRKAPSLGMMRDIFVIHDESMLPVKRPQDAGKGLPGVMFFCNTCHMQDRRCEKTSCPQTKRRRSHMRHTTSLP